MSKNTSNLTIGEIVEIVETWIPRILPPGRGEIYTYASGAFAHVEILQYVRQKNCVFWGVRNPLFRVFGGYPPSLLGFGPKSWIFDKKWELCKKHEKTPDHRGFWAGRLFNRSLNREKVAFLQKKWCLFGGKKVSKNVVFWQLSTPLKNRCFKNSLFLANHGRKCILEKSRKWPVFGGSKTVVFRKNGHFLVV